MVAFLASQSCSSGLANQSNEVPCHSRIFNKSVCLCFILLVWCFTGIWGRNSWYSSYNYKRQGPSKTPEQTPVREWPAENSLSKIWQIQAWKSKLYPNNKTCTSLLLPLVYIALCACVFKPCMATLYNIPFCFPLYFLPSLFSLLFFVGISLDNTVMHILPFTTNNHYGMLYQ